MPTAEKEKEVAFLVERLAAAKSVILSEYAGMDVETVTVLRRKCREQQVEFRVTKNTLMRRALNTRGHAGLDEHLKGPLAVAFAADEVTAAKVLADFAKEHQLPKMTAGLVDGKILSAAQLGALARLPGKTELLTQLVYVLSSPARNLVTVLSAPARNLVMVLGQVEKQKAGAA
ncbi:MAG: 50S ribosomal protein L10 [Candidatus Eisenbacteria bacterium]|nr:50S ribosomal protein L10 [Candidatus Eisenbacteria bacterium]